MKVILKQYLDVLRAKELLAPNGKPEQVPNLSELADSVGLARVTVSRFANNKNHQIPVDLVDTIIGELRDRGFDTKLHDIIIYDEGKELPAYAVGA